MPKHRLPAPSLYGDTTDPSASNREISLVLHNRAVFLPAAGVRRVGAGGVSRALHRAAAATATPVARTSAPPRRHLLLHRCCIGM